MKIILIKTAQQETTFHEDEVSLRNILDKINNIVAHHSGHSPEGIYTYFPEIDEIFKRRKSESHLLANLMKQYWIEWIQDNRPYLYRFIYPTHLKSDFDIKLCIRTMIIETYSHGLDTLVDKMLKYDDTDKIFSDDTKSLGDAFFYYVTIHPENYRKHKPKALANLPDDMIRDTAIDGFFKRLNVPNRKSAIESYQKLPPDIKTKGVINLMIKFLSNLIFSVPYFYETDCPEELMGNEKILSARKTGWINLLNQKSPLLYAILPEDLKQDKDFIKYREPAKKTLIEKLTHPKKETDPSIQKNIDILTDEFKDEDFIVSLFWEQKQEKEDMS